jgi:hypothetical protein
LLFFHLILLLPLLLLLKPQIAVFHAEIFYHLTMSTKLKTVIARISDECMHARENQKRRTKRMITKGKAMAGNNSEELRLSAPMMVVVVVVGILATA